MNDSPTIEDLLIRSANNALETQQDDGSFSQEQTSYYGDRQFPIRTTAQWLRTFTEAYSISKKKKFKHAAKKAASFLLSQKARPNDFTYYCREAEGKDRCNGVFGQAIPIWSLSKAGKKLGEEYLMEEAEDVASLHQYEPTLSLWNRVEVDGKRLPIDRTLNHQIAFAAALSNIEEEGIQQEVNNFLDNFERIAGLRSDGTIRHLVRTPIYKKNLDISNTKTIFRNRLLFEIYRFVPHVKTKETSYQPLNLFWLSQLYLNFPDHPLWRSDFLQRANQLVNTQKYKRELYKTDMGFTVSVSGFYLGIASKLFGYPHQNCVEWIEEQLNSAYQFTSEKIVKDVSDPSKMKSNICYLSEFPDLKQKVKIKN